MKKFIKFLIFSFLILIVLSITFVAFLPTIFSSNFGKNALINYVNTHSEFIVEVEKINLSWTGKQEVLGLLVKDKANRPHIFLKSLALSQPLWSLTKKDFNSLFFNDLNLNFYHSDQENPLIKIKNSNGKLDVHGIQEQSYFEVSGLTEQNDLQGHFKISGKNAKNDLDLMNEFVLNGDFIKFPPILLDQFLDIYHPPLKGVFQDVLGKELNLSIQENIHHPNQIIALKINASNLITELKLDVDPNKIYLHEPTMIDLKITPELFSRIFPESPFILNNPVDSKIWINRFEILAKEITKETIQNAIIEMEFEMGAGHLINPMNDKEIFFSKVTGEIFTPSNKNFLHGQFEIHGTIKDNETFKINIDTDLNKFKLLEGDFDIRDSSTKIETENFPIPLIEDFLNNTTSQKTLQKLSALFGSKISGKITYNDEASININLMGTQGSLMLNGTINQNTLKLKDPLEIELFSIDHLNEIKELFPILGGVDKIDAPLTLKIDPKNFSYPFDENYSNISVSHGIFTSGGIFIKHSNPLFQKVLSMLHIKNKDGFSIKHSPCHFSLRNEIFTFDTMETTLLDEYTFSSAGNLNFDTEKMNITLFVPVKYLGKIIPFKILNNDMIMEIPLKGSFDHPKLNLKKASIKNL